MKKAGKRRPKGISQADWNAVDVPALTAAQLKKMRPAAEVVPELVAAWRARGRPKAALTKELISLRLDSNVLKTFKAEGPGWQTRMNDVLARWARRRAAG